MPSSMTGFGRGTAQEKGRKVVVETRSVNNRFCEVRIQAPKEMLEVEHDVAALIRQSFSRGKFDVTLRMESFRPSSRSDFDEKRMIQLWRKLDRLRKRLALAQPVPLEAILAVSTTQESSNGISFSRPIFLRAAHQAIVRLKRSREQEGKALVSDILQRAQKVDQAIHRILAQTKVGQERRLERMRLRVAEISSHQDLDVGRLETEIAILAERADVTEEIVRLENHLKKLFSLVRSKESIGRELDFLLQEINREINTIGAKAAELGITQDVIFVKSETEKIREQAQNLE